MEAPQQGEPFLDLQHRCGVVHGADHAHGDERHHHRDHAERMQRDARGEQAWHLRVAPPAGHAQHQQADAQHRLQRLAPEQRAHAGAHPVQLAVAQQLPLDGFLPLQAIAQHLPGGFEFVEFHEEFPVTGAVRVRCGRVASAG
jgi:hypothetical protein